MLTPPTMPLQGMCSAGLKGYEYLTNFEFIKAFTCTFANSMGLFVFGTLVYGGISISIYLRTGSAMIPLVLLLITGGVVMAQVAAPVVGMAALLFLIFGAGILTILYQRYSR